MLTVELQSDDVATLQMSINSLEDLGVSGPDDATDGLDGAAEWVLDNWGMDFFIDQIGDPLDNIVNVRYPAITEGID
jgi:hypothetical protein